eukprot:1625081-Prymnesium_polylepis.3
MGRDFMSEKKSVAAGGASGVAGAGGSPKYMYLTPPNFSAKSSVHTGYGANPSSTGWFSMMRTACVGSTRNDIVTSVPVVMFFRLLWATLPAIITRKSVPIAFSHTIATEGVEERSDQISSSRLGASAWVRRTRGFFRMADVVAKGGIGRLRVPR